MSEPLTREQIIKPENLVYRRTPLLTDKALSYCPGCGHGTVHRLIMEVIEELVAPGLVELSRRIRLLPLPPRGCAESLGLPEHSQALHRLPF